MTLRTASTTTYDDGTTVDNAAIETIDRAERLMIEQGLPPKEAFDWSEEFERERRLRFGRQAPCPWH